VRFPRTILLTVSAMLALALTSTSTATPALATGLAAPGRSGEAPLAEGAEETAEKTLAAVQSAFAGATPHRRGQAFDARQVTLLLAELRRRLDDLSPSDRSLARSFLARPTDGGDPEVSYGRAARATNDCTVKPTKGSKVCVHWARATHHAPPLADSDQDRLPNQVERTRNIANAVWDRVVTRGGYRQPPRDHGGPNRKLDIYLANIGSRGLYGYCVAEDRVSGRAYTGYCVLDDDYSNAEFTANTPTQNLQVTLAHEFFHAVQFGYDAAESLWFMEGSAAWIEDEIYDAVNDNHIYLPASPLAEPGRPLDREDGLAVYGSWIFWRFLTERYSGEGRTDLPLLMRRLWADADHLDRSKPRLDAIGALRNEMADHGTTIAESYADFAVANRSPASFYEEGGTYAPSPLHRSPVPVRGTPATGSLQVDHLASATVQLRPTAELGAGRTLELAVTDRARLGPEAAIRVVMVNTSGAARSVQARRTAGGWSVTVPGFGTGAVRHIEVSLANGATSTVRDNATFDYRATASTTGP
jgi:hypothetical protein